MKLSGITASSTAMQRTFHAKRQWLGEKQIVHKAAELDLTSRWAEKNATAQFPPLSDFATYHVFDSCLQRRAASIIWARNLTGFINQNHQGGKICSWMRTRV